MFLPGCLNSLRCQLVLLKHSDPNLHMGLSSLDGSDFPLLLLLEASLDILGLDEWSSSWDPAFLFLEEDPATGLGDVAFFFVSASSDSESDISCDAEALVLVFSNFFLWLKGRRRDGDSLPSESSSSESEMACPMDKAMARSWSSCSCNLFCSWSNWVEENKYNVNVLKQGWI